MIKRKTMAQQQDPEAQYRAQQSARPGIAAGSSDTYRSPGFRSPVTTPDTGLRSITAAPSAEAAAPTQPQLSPGMQAAQARIPYIKEGGGPGQSKVGSAIGGVAGGLAGQVIGNAILPGIGGLIAGVGGKFLGNVLGRNNRSALDDIAGAMALGRPVTDADWARAGYGAGGAAPTTQQSNLRSITQVPTALYGPMAGAIRQQYMQTQPMPATTPPNAVMRY